MKLIILITVMLINYICCVNILFISPMLSPSHHYWNKFLSLALVEKGHNITMFSSIKEENLISNFSVLATNDLNVFFRNSFGMEKCLEDSQFTFIKRTSRYSEFVCRYHLQSAALESLLNYPKSFRFDLIIFDVTTGQCMYPLAERFKNPPLIGVTAYGLPSYINYAFGNHLYPSYTPFYSTDFISSQMSLLQRVLNFIYTYSETFYWQHNIPNEFKMARKRFGKNIRPLEETQRNITLLLSNTDPILSSPVALPPNIIPIGGLHLQPAKPLPKYPNVLRNMWVILIAITFLNYIYCGNILFISPMLSPSHHYWNKGLSLELVKKGHNVTMFSFIREDNLTPNFTVLISDELTKTLRNFMKMEDSLNDGPLGFIKLCSDYSELVCEYHLKSAALESLLNYPETFRFDLIIFDVTAGHCLYPLAQRFNNPPLIGVTAFGLPPYLSYAFGNHLHPSYTPFYGTDYKSEMTLLQRSLNFIYAYWQSFRRQYISIPRESNMAKKRFGENIRPLEEFERNITLLLSATDPILETPAALSPNIIPVGGLHVRPAKPLPKDLDEVVNNSKDGVILFAMGTNVKTSELKPEVIQALVQAFKRLPQLILWKHDLDNVANLSENVVIRKWLPQNDILGHPKTKLFITHGGSCSTQEAMYHGVPVVGIPFFGDQYVNIRRMSERGLGEQLDFRQNVTAEKIYEKIQMVLTSDKYKTNIQRLSKLYKDKPQTALELALFWIEYVMRHGTAEHLVLPARDMPSYKTGNLDVALVFFIVLFMLYKLVAFIILRLKCGASRAKVKVS